MKYRPEIDGLRSLAVMPVILFHAKISGFSGGFVGVDIFFVISGYLITRILAEEMEGGYYSLLRFYERRARRILPALVVVVVVSTVIAWFVLPPLEMQWFGQSVFATAVFASNFYFLFRGRDYFAGQTAEYPLLHTWTLAVEEQFYIVFPVLLWVVWRFGARRLIWIIAGLSLLSLVGAEWLSRHDPGMNFYLLPSRVWELGAGALCALLHHRAPIRQNQVLPVLGLVLILGTVVALPERVRFPSLWAVPPVLGTALVLLYAGPQTWAGRLLALRPFVAIGLASYSAYLWHQPLFAFAHVKLDHDPGWMIMLGLSALAVALGFVSLRLVEAPFRRRGRSGPGRVVVASGGVLALIAAGGLAIYLSHGLPGRPAASHLPRDYYAAVAAPIFPVYGKDLRNCSDLCTVTTPAIPTRRVLLAGDSHAQDLIPAMTALARARDWELVLLIDKGCSFTRLSPFCADSRAALIAHAGTFDEIVMSTRLSARAELHGHPDPDGAIAAALHDYGDLMALITQQGAALTLLTPRPVLNTDPVRAALADRVSEIAIAADIASTAAWNAVTKRLSTNARVRFVDQRALLMASAGCDTTACFDAHDQEGLPLYRDLHHLSPHAAQQVVNVIAAFPR